MEKIEKRKLIKRAVELRPMITVGKNGLGAGQVEEMITRLKANRLIKIKVLQSYFHHHTMEETGAELEKLAPGSRVLQIKGHTIVLYK